MIPSERVQALRFGGDGQSLRVEDLQIARVRHSVRLRMCVLINEVVFAGDKKHGPIRQQQGRWYLRRMLQKDSERRTPRRMLQKDGEGRT